MYTTKSTIKMWAEDDRPREKMLIKGRNALSDSELLAILIGTGTKSKSAVELGQELLLLANNNLGDFAKMSIADLKKIKGIGEAKAITIAAALELGRRRKNTLSQKRLQLTTPDAIYDFITPYFMDLTIEKFYIILLNRANKILDVKCISEGGMSGTVVDAKVIFNIAIEHRAQGIVLVHNHPSGTLKPSDCDIRLTKKIVDFAKMIDLVVLDHIIYTDNGFYSFVNNGLII